MVSKMADYEHPTAEHWPEPPHRYQAIAIVLMLVIVLVLPLVFR
jgi:hypothetical protein